MIRPPASATVLPSSKRSSQPPVRPGWARRGAILVCSKLSSWPTTGGAPGIALISPAEAFNGDPQSDAPSESVDGSFPVDAATCRGTGGGGGSFVSGGGGGGNCPAGRSDHVATGAFALAEAALTGARSHSGRSLIPGGGGGVG